MRLSGAFRRKAATGASAGVVADSVQAVPSTLRRAGRRLSKILPSLIMPPRAVTAARKAQLPGVVADSVATAPQAVPTSISFPIPPAGAAEVHAGAEAPMGVEAARLPPQSSWRQR